MTMPVSARQTSSLSRSVESHSQPHCSGLTFRSDQDASADPSAAAGPARPLPPPGLEPLPAPPRLPSPPPALASGPAAAPAGVPAPPRPATGVDMHAALANPAMDYFRQALFKTPNLGDDFDQY